MWGERTAVWASVALSKALVELHHGTIQARSRGPGSGAEFVVHLPVVDAPAELEQIPKSRSADVPRSLLIVEDNADAAQMLCEVLQQRGHRVAIAETGQQGLELLRRDAFDVVLCDIGLPGMSGYQFARTIRSDSSLGAPALIAITGYGQPEDRKRTAAAGFDAHLVKPVTLELLERVLKVPLESNHP